MSTTLPRRYSTLASYIRMYVVEALHYWHYMVEEIKKKKGEKERVS